MNRKIRLVCLDRHWHWTRTEALQDKIFHKISGNRLHLLDILLQPDSMKEMIVVKYRCVFMEVRRSDDQENDKARPRSLTNK